MARALLLAVVLSLLAAAAAEARPFSVVRDIDYDLGTPPQPPSRPADNRMDIYLPRRVEGRAPIVVWIHGGGWRKGDKRTGVRKKAELFTRRGYLFAAVNYRLASAPFDPNQPDPDRVRFPAQPEDVGEAITWLVRNAAAVGGNSRRIVLVGHSAGAHLAALVALDPVYVGGHASGWPIRGFVALDSPAFDIARAADPQRSQRSRASREMLWNAFGTPLENSISGDWERASPLAFADPRDPPGLMITQAARPERVAENRELLTALAPTRLSEVVPLDLDHREINRVLGARGDRSGATAAVSRFVRKVTR